MFLCVLLMALQTNAFAQYADPLKNPWVFTLEEFWPGSELFEGEGISVGLKVPIHETDQTLFDLWQIEMAKGTETNIVLHPAEFDESDPSFAAASKDVIFKTVVVVKGNIDVYFGNSDNPYPVIPREVIHLMPGTPHKFKAQTDAVLMAFCYGDGVAKDKDKGFIRAYFDAGIHDSFTVIPEPDNLACDQNRRDTALLDHLSFTGPNNEIRPSTQGGYIFSSWFLSGDEPGRGSRNFLKVAAYETNNLMEFVEWEWHDFDFYPHDHPDFLELFLITRNKGAFWVGEGTENGLIDTAHPDYGKIDEEGSKAIPSRKGDGIRVEPGYVIYMPAGVPHSMSDTEDGSIWFGVANPTAFVQELLKENTNKIYKARKTQGLMSY